MAVLINWNLCENSGDSEIIVSGMLLIVKVKTTGLAVDIAFLTLYIPDATKFLTAQIDATPHDMTKWSAVIGSLIKWATFYIKAIGVAMNSSILCVAQTIMAHHFEAFCVM